MQQIRRLVVDVDGCLTDGTFIWGPDGQKWAKMFGPDDWDAMRDLSAKGVKVILVSSDRRWSDIAESRARHAEFEFQIVDGFSIRWEFVVTAPTAYVGDSYSDVKALAGAALSFAPANAHPAAKLAADVVLPRRGGDRAVALACAYIAAGRRLRWSTLRRRLRAVRMKLGPNRRFL